VTLFGQLAGLFKKRPKLITIADSRQVEAHREQIDALLMKVLAEEKRSLSTVASSRMKLQSTTVRWMFLLDGLQTAGMPTTSI
jgi:hypothetical protein